MLRTLKSLAFRLLPWQTDRDGFRRRAYVSRRLYRAHQAHKVFGENLAVHDERFISQLVTQYAADPPASPLLCLGARNGAEVRAFRQVGTWAIGVDLASSIPTPLVIRGDFHHLPFRPHTIASVFSNAIDHVQDLERYLSEIRYVLRRDGLFYCDAVNVERSQKGHYESLWWPSTEALIRRIERSDFRLAHRRDGKNWIHLRFSPS